MKNFPNALAFAPIHRRARADRVQAASARPAHEHRRQPARAQRSGLDAVEHAGKIKKRTTKPAVERVRASAVKRGRQQATPQAADRPRQATPQAGRSASAGNRRRRADSTRTGRKAPAVGGPIGLGLGLGRPRLRRAYSKRSIWIWSSGLGWAASGRGCVVWAPGHARARHRDLVRRDRRRRRAADGVVLSDVVQSQVALHAPYGGVVPELALARSPAERRAGGARGALAQARSTLAEIDGIAVTCRPGLSGALLVGVQAAKASPGRAASRSSASITSSATCSRCSCARGDRAAAAAGVSVRRAARLGRPHGALPRRRRPSSRAFSELGATRDDAAGEAFDKVAKLLGLGYPGGPVIDRLRQDGDAPRRVRAARGRCAASDSLEFSFSGLKTAVARWVDKHGRPGDDQTLRDLCASFQRARGRDAGRARRVAAAQREGVRALVLAGGVAANREPARARARGGASSAASGLVVPPFARLHRQRRDDRLRRRAAPRARRERRRRSCA